LIGGHSLARTKLETGHHNFDRTRKCDR